MSSLENLTTQFRENVKVTIKKKLRKLKRRDVDDASDVSDDSNHSDSDASTNSDASYASDASNHSKHSKHGKHKKHSKHKKYSKHSYGHDTEEEGHTDDCHQHVHPEFKAPSESADQFSDLQYEEPPKLSRGRSIIQQIPGSDRSFHISDCQGNKKAVLIGINYIGMPIALKGK
jgi:hypothetical protein